MFWCFIDLGLITDLIFFSIERSFCLIDFELCLSLRFKYRSMKMTLNYLKIYQ